MFSVFSFLRIITEKQLQVWFGKTTYKTGIYHYLLLLPSTQECVLDPSMLNQTRPRVWSTWPTRCGARPRVPVPPPPFSAVLCVTIVPTIHLAEECGWQQQPSTTTTTTKADLINMSNGEHSHWSSSIEPSLYVCHHIHYVLFNLVWKYSPQAPDRYYLKVSVQTCGIIQKLYETKHIVETMIFVKSVMAHFSKIEPKMSK